jgi:hypothetical protein
VRLGGWGRRYGVVTLAGLALAAAALAGWPRIRTRWRTRTRVRLAARGAAHASDATLLYGRMLSLLAGRGFHKRVWQTPAEFARRIPASPLAALVEEFTQAYHELRYGGRPPAGIRLVALLARIPETPGPRTTS